MGRTETSVKWTRIRLAALVIVLLFPLAGCDFFFPYPACQTEDFHEYLSCAQPRFIGAEEPTEERVQELAEFLASYCTEDADELLPELDSAVIKVIPDVEKAMKGEGVWARHYDFEGLSEPFQKADLFHAVLDSHLMFLEEYGKQSSPGRRGECINLVDYISKRMVRQVIWRILHE